jgi:tetratricopeptide (TPR) repeat protein
MGFLDMFSGGGIEGRLKRLHRTIDEASYDEAEEALLDLRVAISRKYPTGSEMTVRLDLAEVELRTKYLQFDRVEGPARRAFLVAKGLVGKDLLRETSEAMLGCAVRGGRLSETVELAEQWIAVASPDFKQRIDVLITKGSALNQLNRFNDALRSYEAAVRLVEAMPAAPDRHERFVTATSGMGDAYLGLDNRAQAINCWRQAMAATRAQLGDEHPQVASILVCIGTVQLNADEIEPACGSFTQALEVFRAAGHSESMGAAIALQKLALANLMKGEVTLAWNTVQDAIRASASHGPEMRTQAHELLRKIEDSKLAAPGAPASPTLIRPQEEASPDGLSIDRSILPPRMGANRTPARSGRSNINANWAALGR